MNEDEAKKILRRNELNFPEHFKNMSAKDAKELRKEWADDFADYPYELIDALYTEAIKDCTYIVTPAHIFGKMKAIKHANSKSTVEIWQQFLKDAKYIHELVSHFWCDSMMDNSGKMLTRQEIKQTARDYFDQLDPDVKRFAGDIFRMSHFCEMDKTELESVTFSQFRRFIEDQRQRSEVLELTSSAALQLGRPDNVKMIGE